MDMDMTDMEHGTGWERCFIITSRMGYHFTRQSELILNSMIFHPLLYILHLFHSHFPFHRPKYIAR